MILLPLAQGSAVLETSSPKERDVAIAAYAPLPKPFGEKDRQRLAVAVRVLVEGSQDFGRRAIFNLTDGRTVEAALLPDGVAVRFVMPREELRNGLSLMESLLRRPLLDGPSLDRALRRLQRREVGYWGAALRPLCNDLKSIKPAEARALLGRVFTPGRTVVAVAGAFAPGEASGLWERRVADWKALPEPRYPDISPTPEPKENPSGITTVELRGLPLSPTDPDLPARWLALVALGVGKGASLFRDVRQVEGWSYRQEAILWPDVEGLVPRIVVAATPEEGETGRADALRSALRKAAAAWTEADRARALGMAALSLERGLPVGPLWLADGPPGGDLADRALLDAYWSSKAHARWDPARLLAAMREVPLGALKAEADDLLEKARPIVLPGR